MKFKLLSLLVLFSISLSAKHFPKWKEGNFKTTSSGLQYKIVKKGKGDSIGKNDSVVVEYAYYDLNSHKEIIDTKKMAQKTGAGNMKFSFSMNSNSIGEGFKESVSLLKEGGSGYFIVPPKDSSEDMDKYYFIRIYKVVRDYSQYLPIVTPPNDTINFHMPDPDRNRFGDTLFTTMQMLETPMKVKCSGYVSVLQAIKFRITYFDHGVQHKDVLIYVDCPEGYGQNYFEPGKDYVITCIPLMENHKKGKQVQDSYPNEKIERYYCLVIRKMN